MKTSINIATLKQLREENGEVMIIDVRSEMEFIERHIPGAIHIPVEDIVSGKQIPGEAKLIITVCGKGGGRSERSAEYLRETCSTDCYFLEGGTSAWFESKK